MRIYVASLSELLLDLHTHSIRVSRRQFITIQHLTVRGARAQLRSIIPSTAVCQAAVINSLLVALLTAKGNKGDSCSLVTEAI